MLNLVLVEREETNSVPKSTISNLNIVFRNFSFTSNCVWCTVDITFEVLKFRLGLKWHDLELEKEFNLRFDRCSSRLTLFQLVINRLKIDSLTTADVSRRKVKNDFFNFSDDDENVN